MIKNIYDKAILQCPYKCKTPDLTLANLESHMQLDCPVAIVACPNECGMRIHKSKLAEHMANECTNAPITCKLCKGLYKKNEPHEV